MSNNISFVGRIGQTPEHKQVGSSEVLEFSIANNVGFGEKKSTNWFRCTVWGKRASTLKQYMEKGKQVFITGELILRKYTANDGTEKMSPDIRVAELDFVGGQSDGASGGGAAAGAAPGPAQTTAAGDSPTEAESDMPF